jgi:hypothetical protein
MPRFRFVRMTDWQLGYYAMFSGVSERDTADGPKPGGGCADCTVTGDTWVHLR